MRRRRFILPLHSEFRLSDVQDCGYEHVILKFTAAEHVVAGFQVGERNALSILTKGSILVDGNLLRNTIRSLDGQLCPIDGLDFAGDEALAHAFSEISAGTVGLTPSGNNRRSPGVLAVLFSANEDRVAHFEITEHCSFPTLAILRLIVNRHLRSLAVPSFQRDRVRIDRGNSSGEAWWSLAVSVRVLCRWQALIFGRRTRRRGLRNAQH